MDKIEKIRQEIGRLMALNNASMESTKKISRISAAGYYEALVDVENFLDTLSEEPDKGLEEAAEEYRRESFKKSVMPQIDGPVSEYGGSIKNAFIAGAEWQASQMPMPEDTVLFNKGVQEGRRLEREDMMKDAVEGYVNYYEDSGGILMAEAQVGCPYHNGDKVRIIVMKEEEQI